MVRPICMMAIAGLAAVALPAPAAARFVYFHKAGVGRDMFTADALECESLASGVRSPSVAQPYSPNLYATAVTSLLSGFLKSSERRGMIDNVLRTCMFDKGYRRVEASDHDGDMMKRLPDADRLERLAAFAATSEPQGKMLPQ